MQHKGWYAAGRRALGYIALSCIALGWMLAVGAQAQGVSTTTVQGTVYLANGQPGAGTLVIKWPAFTTAAGQAITAGSTTVTVPADGFVSVNLAPNQGATPAGEYYTAVYYLSDGSTNTEYWVVPAAAQATLAQVRAQVMPAAQAVQAASKSYVDQTIAELSQSLLTASGGNLSGPLYLNGDPSQALQAATKHYVDSLFSEAVPLTGAALTGPLTATRLGAAWQVDQFPGADFGARLQACVNALDPAYGGTCDARNFTGSQSMSANLTIPSGNTTVLLPCATISTASQIIVPAGVRNVALRGCAVRGGSAASGSTGGTAFAYSGAGAMVQVGDTTYAVDSSGFHMDNAVINTTPSTSAAAQAFAAYRTQELDLESLYLLGNANQTGLTLDGTGNYTGGTFLDDQISGFQTAVNAIGHQVANSATTDWLNASSFLRLHIDCPTSSGSPIAGTYGINLQQGDGNTFTGGDVEGCATALHLGPNAQNNTIVGLRNENSNQQVVADAGSSYNNWITGGTMFTGQLTDNGTRNSFLDTFHRSFNALNGDWYGSQQDTTLTNHFRLGIGTGNERGLLNRYQTDSGYRWTMGLSDATAGEQFYQVLDELNGVYRISIGQYNSGQSSTNNQTVLNSAGTGAVVLNGSNGSGTGGVIFGSGGPSETTVVTVDKSGNAQFNGALQVGGTSQSTGTMTVRNNADSEVDYYLWPGLTASQKGSFTYKDWNGASQWYMVKDANNNWALNSALGGLDSFKAYQSTNSGDTYINASNPTGVVRVNYETGSGGGFKVYGGNSSTLYASFTGAGAIAFPGLAAGSGHNCLQIDASGYVTNTGAACGTGSGGSGTVSSSTSGYIAYYSGDGTSIAGTSAVPVTAGGTGATTAAQALAGLGGLPTTGGTVTGPLNGTSATFSNTVAVGTSIQTKDGTRFVDVGAFGAKCDGVTNDTAAIANAFAAAGINGSIKSGVRFPVGTCLTDPINLPSAETAGLTIEGQGPYTRTNLQSRTGLPVFDLANTGFESFSIRDLDITGTSAGNACIYLESTTVGYQLEISNVQFSCGGSAILDKSIDFNSTLDHIVVRNAGGNAVDMAGDNSMSIDHVMVQNLNCNNCAAFRVHAGTLHLDNANGIFHTYASESTAAATTSSQITLSNIVSGSGNPIPVVSFGHGETLEGTGIPAGTTINSQVSGTPGGAGIYQLSNTVSVSAGTIVTNYYAGDWWGVFGDNVAEDGRDAYVRLELDNSDVESFGQGGSAGTGGVRMKYDSVYTCNTSEFVSQPDSIDTVAVQNDGFTLPGVSGTSTSCDYGGSGAFKNGQPLHSGSSYSPFSEMGDTSVQTYWSDNSGTLQNVPYFGAVTQQNLNIQNSMVSSTIAGVNRLAYAYVPVTSANSPYALHAIGQPGYVAGMAYTLDATNGNARITLDPASYYRVGDTFVFKRIDATANGAFISSYGTQTFDGVASNCYLTAQWQSVTIMSNGSNWNIIQGQCGIPPVYAPLASPAFTGTPTAPTAAAGTNTAQLATTAFVQAAVTPTTYTVSTLPACNAGSKGLKDAVSDATSPTYLGTLTGGGTVYAPVICNGTAWVSY